MKYLLFGLLMLSSLFSLGKEPKPFEKKNIFIGGYDPVTYITKNKAIKGKKAFSSKHKGSTIYFSSQESKNLFDKSPSEFWPEYNGYCAYALATGNGLVSINPKKFKVINKKTYLFYTGFFADTLEKWNEGSDKRQMTKADSSWKRIVNK